VWAIVLATAAWSLLLRGLWFAPVSPDPVVDLEGGGGFAAGLGVYLPAFGLTLLFLVALIVGAFNPRSAVPLVVTVTMAGFAGWVLAQDYLLDYKPSLAFHLWLSIALATTGAGVAAIARFAVRPDGHAARDDVPRSLSA